METLIEKKECNDQDLREYVSWPENCQDSERKKALGIAGRKLWKRLTPEQKWGLRFFMFEDQHSGYFGIKPGCEFIDCEWDFETFPRQEAELNSSNMTDEELAQYIREFPQSNVLISEGISRLLLKC